MSTRIGDSREVCEGLPVKPWQSDSYARKNLANAIKGKRGLQVGLGWTAL
jgi:hypothetical protein